MHRDTFFFFFFFNDTATTEIYTLSLHDALPILDVDSLGARQHGQMAGLAGGRGKRLQNRMNGTVQPAVLERSEEHTSELQSQSNLVCRLLLEKKKTQKQNADSTLRYPQHVSG